MKKQVIYNNYNLWDDFYDDIIENLRDDGYTDDEITDEMIWNDIYVIDTYNWDDVYSDLQNFFTGHGHFLLMGNVGRWDGQKKAGYIFNNFDDMFYKATKDCDYIKIWDEKGHFYIECSHHDGTNIFEIKRINEKAYNFIDNWAYNWGDDRTEEEIHSIVWNSNFLSCLPYYYKTIYNAE